MHRHAPPHAPLLLVATGVTLVAHDRRTGDVAWRFHAGPTAGSRTTMRCVVEGERVVTVAPEAVDSMWSADVSARVTCLDYATGRALWDQRLDAPVNSAHFSATLMIDSGQLIVVHGPLLAAIALDTGAIQWTRSVEGRDGGPDDLASALVVPGRDVQGDRT